MQKEYSSVDLTFAYGQVLLHPLTRKRCNFHIFRGESTGRYCLITGLYCLTVMLTDFRNAKENFLARFGDVFIFIDDFLSF